jgi:hypothetical protein
MEHLKYLKTGRVPYLGLELTMHIIKSQIYLVRQSLYCKSIIYADNLQLKHGKPLSVNPCWTSKSVVPTLMKPLKQYLHTVPKLRFMYSQK